MDFYIDHPILGNDLMMIAITSLAVGVAVLCVWAFRKFHPASTETKRLQEINKD